MELRFECFKWHEYFRHNTVTPALYSVCSLNTEIDVGECCFYPCSGAFPGHGGLNTEIDVGECCFPTRLRSGEWGARVNTEIDVGECCFI